MKHTFSIEADAPEGAIWVEVCADGAPAVPVLLSMAEALFMARRLLEEVEVLHADASR